MDLDPVLVSEDLHAAANQYLRPAVPEGVFQVGNPGFDPEVQERAAGLEAQIVPHE